MKNNSKPQIQNLQDVKKRKAQLKQEMRAARLQTEASLYKLTHTTPWSALSIAIPVIGPLLKGVGPSGKNTKSAWWESLLSAAMGAAQAYTQFAESASSET